MAFKVAKKLVSFSVKKTIKKLLKKILPSLTKKQQKMAAAEETNHDSEINENLQNEFLEARLRQMIQDSPAVLCHQEEYAVVTDCVYRLDQNCQALFASFWMNEEEQTDAPNYSQNLRYRSCPQSPEDDA